MSSFKYKTKLFFFVSYCTFLLGTTSFGMHFFSKNYIPSSIKKEWILYWSAIQSSQTFSDYKSTNYNAAIVFKNQAETILKNIIKSKNKKQELQNTADFLEHLKKIYSGNQYLDNHLKNLKSYLDKEENLEENEIIKNTKKEALQEKLQAINQSHTEWIKEFDASCKKEIDQQLAAQENPGFNIYIPKKGSDFEKSLALFIQIQDLSHTLNEAEISNPKHRAYKKRIEEIKIRASTALTCQQPFQPLVPTAPPGPPQGPPQGTPQGTPQGPPQGLPKGPPK